VRFDGVGDRDQAQELHGAVLEVDRSEAPPRPDGEVYFYQLVGCRCRDRTAGDLGEIVEVVEDGGGALLIAAQGSRQVPIPFVASFITRLDLEAGELDLDLPAGLVEACASES
jgi:16S rRNA processing protein RimM